MSVGIFDRLERRIESAVGRLFPRRRGERVQPAEIARALVRAMESEQRLSVKTVYVPNVFRVHLHPQDLEPLRAVQRTIERDITQYLAAFARKRGFSFAGPVRFFLVESATAREGEPLIEAFFQEESEPEERGEETIRVDALGGPRPETYSGEPARPKSDDLAVTQRFHLAKGSRSQEGRALMLEVVAGPDRGRTLALDEHRPLSVGRTAECDLVLSDTRVSKVHALFRYKDGAWWVEDQGSTNGTHVNGRSVAAERVSEGDEVTLGLSTLKVVRKERPF